MQVRSIDPSQIEPVHAFLSANGWAHRVGSLEQFSELVGKSQRTAVAFHETTILGFARGITDGLSNGYLSMVVVLPGHRRQGIGRALVQHIIGDDSAITWVLRADREGAPAFFGKLGFAASEVAMERRRAAGFSEEAGSRKSIQIGGSGGTRYLEKPMPTDSSPVSLREITSETVIRVCRLSVAESQKGFVAPNAVSLAQALFAPEAWYRAIYAGEEPAGFVMIEDESLRSPPPAEPEVGVWRFMVDEKFQGRGIGRAALLQVIEHVRAKRIFKSLVLSYVPGPGCPEPFYLGLGFRHTGRVDGQEVILELPLLEN